MRLPNWQGWLRGEDRGGRDDRRSARGRQAGRRASRRPSAASRHTRIRLLERLETRCVLTATLTGQLFHDLDGDQIWEPQAPSLEPALGCWSVYLDENRNGAMDDGEPRQLTSVDGAYSFTGLDSGEHVVNVVPDPAFDRTRPIQFGLTSRLETGATADHVFDPVRNVLYTAQTDRILRTKTDQSQQLLTALGVGGDLSAVDVTPDGQFLVVGEAATANGEGRVYKVAIETGDITTISFPLDVGEGGVVDLVVLNDHQALVTTHSTTASLVTLRQVD